MVIFATSLFDQARLTDRTLRLPVASAGPGMPRFGGSVAQKRQRYEDRRTGRTEDCAAGQLEGRLGFPRCQIGLPVTTDIGRLPQDTNFVNGEAP